MFEKELAYAKIAIVDIRSLGLARERAARPKYNRNLAGTLKVNGLNGSVDLRTVMKISRADNESLKGVFFYGIDQGGTTPIGTTSITLKGSAVKVSITPLNGTFEGTLSGDGTTIIGKWMQGGPALPFNLVRATEETAWTIPEPPPPPLTMPATAKPEFVVATIKPSRPDAPRGGYGFRGQDVTTTNVTVNWMIKLAYNVHARQIEGGRHGLIPRSTIRLGGQTLPASPAGIR